MLPVLNKKSIEPFARNPLINAMDRLMDEMFTDGFALVETGGRMDMYEAGDKLYVEAEVPGFKHDELDLSLENNVLTVKAEQRIEEEDKNVNYYIRERRRQRWARSIRLPVNVDNNKINASFNDGILKIEMEKAEVAKAHKIQIK